MNCFTKKVLIIFAVFIAILCFVVIFDYSAYRIYTKTYRPSNKRIETWHYELITKKEILKRHKISFQEDIRKPDGSEFKNSKHSITIFGCSLAYGAYLKQKQTIGYKLANILKVPVYNKALSMGSIQEIWYLSGAEGAKELDMPHSDTYIYFMMYDHYRRLYTLTKAHCWRQHFNYIDKKGHLRNEMQSNFIKNILSTTYAYKLFTTIKTDKFMQNPKNKDEILAKTVLYIAESKKALEIHTSKKINFIVVLWDKINYKKELKEKLEKQGIIVIDTDELSDENLMDIKYIISETNDHPNENAWDLITPLLAQRIEKIWQEENRRAK